MRHGLSYINPWLINFFPSKFPTCKNSVAWYLVILRSKESVLDLSIIEVNVRSTIAWTRNQLVISYFCYNFLIKDLQAHIYMTFSLILIYILIHAIYINDKYFAVKTCDTVYIVCIYTIYLSFEARMRNASH